MNTLALYADMFSEQRTVLTGSMPVSADAKLSTLVLDLLADCCFPLCQPGTGGVPFRATLDHVRGYVVTSPTFQLDDRRRRPSGKTAPAQLDRVSLPRVTVIDSSVTWPIDQQVRELLAALSLNKSQLAQVLGVSRPTLYSWFDGSAEPAPMKAERLHTIVRALHRAGIEGREPLNARFVRHAIDDSEPSLFDLLSHESLDLPLLVARLEAAQDLTIKDRAQRAEREVALARRGFESPSLAERKERLATNVALLDLSLIHI